MECLLNRVFVSSCSDYEPAKICSLLPDSIFMQIKPGDRVVIKPNWVFESHKIKRDDWEYVITHPAVISAVIKKVLDRLSNCGRISIIDGPMTEASFAKLLSRYPVSDWRQWAEQNGIQFEIVDLRDHEWVMKNGVIVDRISLPGDPRGKVLVDLLGDTSEFWGHNKTSRGYYGADYDIAETNRAHDGYHNLYSVSRTVIESDVFVNIPKLKTHRKAGITCCLKNLVGINTYKNYLPHHSEGGPHDGGDQFPVDTVSTRFEGPLIGFVKQNLLMNPMFARILSPFKTLALKVFGNSSSIVRNGSWYGNDTIWRMILDLNKVLFYSGVDGSMGDDTPLRRKRYIGVVDAIYAGEGDGPLAPDCVKMGYLFCGTNPVSIDYACACFMGFDPSHIRSIAQAFHIQKYPLCEFTDENISVVLNDIEFNIMGLPEDAIFKLKPQFGWIGSIEKNTY
ncbi:MAG: DUF362 domain-containing protein [Sulfurimonas sp.]|nr:DUF362 domain-containing protein [Sulfurimonas sp.]